MKKLLMLSALLLNYSMLDAVEENVNQPSTKTAQSEISNITFTPPPGWRQVEKNTLTPSILAMVVGKGEHELPPSINLAFQNESGTLKQFLRFVKDVNQADGIEWKDLGQIRTLAGEASLSQLDIRTEWGIIREMQVIYVKDNTAYILTAGALKDEFPKFYKEFFASLRSLNITKSAPQ